MTTAGLIIIGDEILTGKVKDENSLVFAKIMFRRGVELKRIIIIPDEIKLIAKTLEEFIKSYDYVATSGGIGPTHDDVTLDGIACALNEPLVNHKQAIDYFRKAQEQAGRGSAISDVQLKMLRYPKSAQVYFTKPMWLPLIRINNLFVLPGVPSLFAQLLESWSELFVGGCFYREIIYTNESESSIAANLGLMQNKFSSLKIGSYPQEPGKDFRVMVSIEGREENLVNQAVLEILPVIQGRR